MHYFAAAQQTSRAELGVFSKLFSKKVRVLSVNETKPPSTNAFLADNFALESQKRPRNEERTLFQDSSWSLGLSLNP